MKREWPQGASPFFSPIAGDVLRSRRTGVIREVISVTTTGVDYEVRGKRKTCKLPSWACWCTRQDAEFLEGRVKRC